jgi:cytochrome c553
MRWLLAMIAQWPWVAIPALLTLAGIFAFSVVVAGVVPIAASPGHWPITEWFLQFGKRRSIATHAMFVPSPPQDLTHDARVLQGAGHFETACRPCHGAPGDQLPVIPHAMVPHPPALQGTVHRWADRELFYIVKHGLKFTGMPAWPAQQRDDEVWSMIGFLRRVPHLSAEQYRAMVRSENTSLAEIMAGGATDRTPPAEVIEICARCHGVDGNGRGEGAFPKLAGQRFEYLMLQMRAFADKRRFSGIMQPLATNLSQESLQRVLQYYATLPQMAPSHNTDAAAAARGAALAHDGVEAQEIPACASCHSVDLVNDAYPRLYGQYARYLVQQLQLFQQRNRGGSEFVHIMHNFVDRLTEQQIHDLAAYFSSHAAPR